MGRNKANFIPLVTYDSSGLTTAFQELSASNTNFHILQIVNESSQGITLSFDGGVTANWYVSAGNAQSLDFIANEAFQYGDIYVKAAAAGTGNIYVMGLES